MTDFKIRGDAFMNSENKTGRSKRSGLRHLIGAASYSLDGARRLAGEAAFRHEIAALAAAVCLFAAVGATPFQYLALAVLFLLMMAFEAVNTAIEEIVDRVSPEISPMGKHAKDLGSFAVSCLVLANAIYAGSVVFGAVAR